MDLDEREDADVTKKDTKPNEGRRNFLKLATVAAPAAAAASVTGTEAAAEVEQTTGSGLRKTDHVKAYLDSARF